MEPWEMGKKQKRSIFYILYQSCLFDYIVFKMYFILLQFTLLYILYTFTIVRIRKINIKVSTLHLYSSSN